MGPAPERRLDSYMQILACINISSSLGQPVGSHNRAQDGSTPFSDSDGDAAERSPLDAGLTREQPIETDAVIDAEDEIDPEGYGFGV